MRVNDDRPMLLNVFFFSKGFLRSISYVALKVRQIPPVHVTCLQPTSSHFFRDGPREVLKMFKSDSAYLRLYVQNSFESNNCSQTRDPQVENGQLTFPKKAATFARKVARAPVQAERKRACRLS